ncbi:MAG TPA: hypothetical protein VNG53_04800 [Bacteroidia bacterium]|nr:hypothetical protein [Bacteroidia bacterium]
MKLKNKIILFLGVLSIVVINSCVKDKGPVPTTQTTLSSSCDTIGVTYTNSISLIMTTYCNSGGNCHSNTNGFAPYNYTTYAGVFANMNTGTNGIYYRVFIEPTTSSLHMPSSASTGPTSLTACDAAKLKAWIDAGGPQ